MNFAVTAYLPQQTGIYFIVNFYSEKYTLHLKGKMSALYLVQALLLFIIKQQTSDLWIQYLLF
jgi:hypothetical protein